VRRRTLARGPRAAKGRKLVRASCGPGVAGPECCIAVHPPGTDSAIYLRGHSLLLPTLSRPSSILQRSPSCTAARRAHPAVPAFPHQASRSEPSNPTTTSHHSERAPQRCQPPSLHAIALLFSTRRLLVVRCQTAPALPYVATFPSVSTSP
jgi:hypothetical protein